MLDNTPLPDETVRSHLAEAEALAGRRATERPYMSPEERLARIEEHAEAALRLLDEAENYSCAVTGELVSIDDAEIYGRPGHRIEPEDGCVWTEDDWCDCVPLRVAVVPDPPSTQPVTPNEEDA